MPSDYEMVWEALRLTDRKTDAHDNAKAALSRIEERERKMREALNGAPLPAMTEEAHRAWYRGIRRAALQIGGTERAEAPRE